jgi:hypothetical protein
VVSLKSVTRICICLCALASIEFSTASAARPYAVSRSHSMHRSPYSSSAYARYRGHYGRRYSNSYSRSRNATYSTFYGYGARRYNYRYRPYAAAAGFRYYRPYYYGFNSYPVVARYSSYRYNSFNSRPFCNSWNTYSSCYCSPYSGRGYRNSYAPYWGSYTPMLGSYVPYASGYYASPWSYYPGSYGSFYGPYSGIWPYRPTLYGSIVFQSGYNVGYGHGSYYRFW